MSHRRPRHDQAQLDRLKNEVAQAFPELIASEEAGHLRFKGPFRIEYEGRRLDTYEIEIDLPQDYPDSQPIVRESAGRIPRAPDRHVNSDGALCICLPEEYWLHGFAERPLIDYISGPVRTYLLGNSLVELGAGWPHGEWAHGSEGLLQFYQEHLGPIDGRILRGYLDYLARPEVRGHWLCPCGSGKVVRKCHMPALRRLRDRIPPSVAAKSLSMLAASSK
ncbi:MAG: SEC-C domain-containing protein [bacterium]